MKIPSCLNCETLNCFINHSTNPEWKKKIDGKRSTVRLGKSMPVFHEGDAVHGIYFIYRGKIKVFNRGIKNKTQIVRLANSGQILGHRGIGTTEGYPISASALEDSVVCFIPIDIFNDALKNNPDLVMDLMNFFGEELRRAENKLRSLSQMTVRQKMAETFLTLAEIYGTQRMDSFDFLNVELSRQDYADITGTSLEEVIRTISQMAKDNLIRVHGKKIGIHDYQVLKDMLVDFGKLRLP